MTTILSPIDLPINEKFSQSNSHPLNSESNIQSENVNNKSFLDTLHNFDVSISTPVFRFEGGSFLNAIAYCASAVFIEETFILVIILLHCIFGL